MGSIFKGIRMRIAKGTRHPDKLPWHCSRAGIAKLICDWTWLPIAAAAVLAAPLALLVISIHRLATGRVDTD